MNPNPPPNNNRAPRPLPKPSLTPEERKIWLASHNAPKDMMLVAISEFAQLTAGMMNGQRTLIVLKTTLERGAEALGEYWKKAPDLESAAADAVFDANRYEQATTKAIARLEKSIALYDVLLRRPEIGPVVMLDVITERNLAVAELFAIKDLANSRRPRTDDGTLDLSQKFPPKP